MGFLKSGTWYNIVLAPVSEVMSSNVKVLLKPISDIRISRKHVYLCKTQNDKVK